MSRRLRLKQDLITLLILELTKIVTDIETHVSIRKVFLESHRIPIWSTPLCTGVLLNAKQSIGSYRLDDIYALSTTQSSTFSWIFGHQPNILHYLSITHMKASIPLKGRSISLQFRKLGSGCIARSVLIAITHSSYVIGFILVACAMNKLSALSLLAAGASGDHFCVVCFVFDTGGRGHNCKKNNR